MNEAWARLIVLGIACTRGAACLALLPLLSREAVPTLVRNSIIVAFGVIVLMIEPMEGAAQRSVPQLTAMFARETFIGLILGLTFSGMLFAVETAGQMIDIKLGGMSAQLNDPMSGGSSSLHGALLSRLGTYVFVSSGGLMLLVGALMESYRVWPIGSNLPNLNLVDSIPAAELFGRILGLATAIAAPILAILTLVEGGMGLMNRIAPQLNVFALSLSIKSWLSSALILLMTSMLVNSLVGEVGRASVDYFRIIQPPLRHSALRRNAWPALLNAPRKSGLAPSGHIFEAAIFAWCPPRRNLTVHLPSSRPAPIVTLGLLGRATLIST